MMEAYGRAVIEERLNPRQFAEIASFVRLEYGRKIGPGFLLADAWNAAAAGKPRKRRQGSMTSVLRTLVRAVRSLVAGDRNVRKAKALNPTR